MKVQERRGTEAEDEPAGIVQTGRAAGLGQQLKAIRKHNNWTLKQVAERTGIATSTLSKVENQRISLTYDNILKLAQGLEVDVAELFTPSSLGFASNRRSVARKWDGWLQETANYDYYYLCRDLKNKKMLPIVSVVKSRTIEEFGPMFQHSGEEFIYVLSGVIEVHTGSYEPLRLEAGEGVYIDSTMPHAYISVSADDAVVLGVCTSPEQDPDKLGPPRGTGSDAANRPARPRARRPG